jgi:hypothetical protein
MAGHYQRILEGITANPDQRLSELPLLTDEERHQILMQWNDTKADYPKNKCIHELFEEQVERAPDAIAVVFEGQRSPSALNGANQLAHYRKQGVGPEVLVESAPAFRGMILGVWGFSRQEEHSARSNVSQERLGYDRGYPHCDAANDTAISPRTYCQRNVLIQTQRQYERVRRIRQMKLPQITLPT